MGQKIHPTGYRVGVTKEWSAKWFTGRRLGEALVGDWQIRKYIKKNNSYAGISEINIKRISKYIKVNIHTARAGILIGKRGANLENLQKDLQKLTDKEVRVYVKEIKTPELDAQLVAEGVARQMEKMRGYRRVMTRAIELTMDKGAKGIKIKISGRLAGAEIARREWVSKGSLPLQRIAADIDYGFAEANTTAGKIGVKVWIHKGDFSKEDKENVDAEESKTS